MPVANLLFGQRLVTTLSGQKIYIKTEGHWHYDSTYILDKNKEVDMYFYELKDLNASQKSVLRKILRASEFKEVNLALQSDQLDYAIAKKEVQYYDAKLNKNKELSKVLKNELEMDKKTLFKLIQQYKTSNENLELLYSLNKYSLQDKERYIREFAEVYEVQWPIEPLKGHTIEESLELSESLETSHKDDLNMRDERELLVMDSKDIIDSLVVDYTPTERIEEDMGQKEKEASGEGSDRSKQSLTQFKEKEKLEVSRKRNKQYLIHSYPNTYLKPECHLKDDIRKRRSRYVTTYPQFLCGHVPTLAKNYFRDTYLLEILSAAVNDKGEISLHLRIEITNRDAAKNYGNIKEGSLVKFVGINGTHLNLMTQSQAKMTLEPITGKVIYEIVCPLSKNNLKFLKKNPIDFMGIMWTSGFEAYTVYEVDVVMNQFDCVTNFKKGKYKTD